MKIKFTTTRAENETISKCVARFHALLESEGIEHDTPLTGMMDLAACHLNGCPLDFERLLSFPDFDFVHDMAGIRRHIDRSTGKLGDCFLPRCAALEAVC